MVIGDMVLGMALVRKILIIVIIFAIGVLLLVSLYKKDQAHLVATESTHRNLVFFENDGTEIINGYKIRFVLYDKDAQSVQVCIRSPKKNTEYLQIVDRVRFSVDEKAETTFYVFEQSGIIATYISFLLKDINDPQSIDISLDGIQTRYVMTNN